MPSSPSGSSLPASISSGSPASARTGWNPPPVLVYTRPVTASPIETTVRELCQYIEQNCQSTLSLAHLARHAGVSPFHLQRNFQSLIGLSPRQFQQACRLQRLKANLRQGAPAADAIFDAGYGSLSRVYEHTNAYLGMTPIACPPVP